MSAQEPRPRRTREGAVVVGPTVSARYRPGALIGLPLLAAVLAPLAATGLQAWALRVRDPDGPARALADLLAPVAVQLLGGFLLTWVLLAAWALVAVAATTPGVVLDERGRIISRRRRGQREQRPLADVQWAIGDGMRDSSALIGLAGEEEPWVVPHVGWDDPSFDGLRVLQAAAGLRPSPPRPELVALDRRRSREAAHREMAEGIAMPWREEYVEDPAAFQRDFDHARRVLGGKEPGEGSARPPAGA